MFDKETLTVIAMVLLVLLSLGAATAVGAPLPSPHALHATHGSAGERAATLQETGMESEPNDAPATANPVESGAAIRGEISQPTDIDAFALTVEAGRTIRANLTRTAGDGLLVLLIYGPDGSAVSAVLADPGTTTQLSAPANATGRYDVVIGSAGNFGVERPDADGVGDYLLEVDARSIDDEALTFPTETGTEEPSTAETPTTVETPATSGPVPTTSAGSGSGSAVTEREPNDGPTSANGITLGDTVGGTIADPTDVDWYRVEVPAGESVRLELARPAGDGSMIFGMVIPSGDPLTAGRVLGGETVELTADSVGTGTYYVLVGSERENPGVGPYTLTVAGSALVPDTLEELEPNDSPQLATGLQLGQRMSATISDPDDVDVYALRMEGGRTYNVTVVRGTEGGTLGLSLLGPSGTIVPIGGEEVFPTPYVETYLTYDAAETGVFYLTIRADDATGPYTVTMVEESASPTSAPAATRSTGDAAGCGGERNPYLAAFDDGAADACDATPA